MRMHKRLEQALLKHTEQNRRRVWTPSDTTASGVLNFTNNDYLGLANHPKICEAFKSACDQYGVGSKSAGTLGGYTAAHQALENALADFLSLPAVKLFSCGYMANLGVQSALFNQADTLFHDRDNHASLIDGARLSDAKLKRYPHQDSAQMDTWMHEQNNGLSAIVTDALFSMRGDFAPLSSLTQLAQQHDATLIIDDAHGLGCLGETGRGTLEALGVPLSTPQVLMGTFGKAFGTYGAFVAGDSIYIDAISQFARTQLFTTMLPPALAAATLGSLKLIQSEPERRSALQARITQWCKSIQAAGLNASTNPTPIQILTLKDEAAAIAAGHFLNTRGIQASVIRPPTVLADRCCLRFSLRADHAEAEIDTLIETLLELPK